MRYQLKLKSLGVGFFDQNQFFSRSSDWGIKDSRSDKPRLLLLADCVSGMHLAGASLYIEGGQATGIQSVEGSSWVRKSDHVGDIASPTFKLYWEAADADRFTFLTESLILAQNERWRRG